MDGRVWSGIRAWRNWSVKAEYLRAQFDDTTLNVPLNPQTGLAGTVKASQDIDLIRAGITTNSAAGPAAATNLTFYFQTNLSPGIVRAFFVGRFKGVRFPARAS